MKLPKCVVLAALGALCVSCDAAKDWTLFVYPSGESGFAIVTPGFDREMRRFAGREAVQSHLHAPGRQAAVARGDNGAPTFECGRSCKIGDLKSVATCAETFDASD